MKKYFKIIALGSVAALLSTNLQAQINPRIGIKAGGNLGLGTLTFNANNSSEFGVGPGGYLGGLLEISGKNKSSKLKFQAELLGNYNTVHFDSRNFRMLSLSMPLMLRYFVVPNFSFNAGMSLNVNLSGDFVANRFITLEGYSVSQFQPGVLAGMTYYVYKGLFLDLRYNHYFMNAVESPVFAFQYGSVQLGIGYKFR